MIQVFDASATVACLFDTETTGDWCRKRLRSGGLAAPHQMPFETANVIRRREVHKATDPFQAATALRDLLELDVELVPFGVLAKRVWELRHNLTAYDASYVATAELFDCRLVTVDRRIAKAPGINCEVAVAPAH